MSNAKSGIGNLLGKIDNNYQQLVQSKLHPLDEYDRFHIQQWQTVEVIREEWEECFTDSDQPLALMDSTQPLALMSEVADDDFTIMRDVKQNLKFLQHDMALCSSFQWASGQISYSARPAPTNLAGHCGLPKNYKNTVLKNLASWRL